MRAVRRVVPVTGGIRMSTLGLLRSCRLTDGWPTLEYVLVCRIDSAVLSIDVLLNTGHVQTAARREAAERFEHVPLSYDLQLRTNMPEGIEPS